MWMVLGWMGCVQAPDPGGIDAPGASTARSMLWLLLVGCSPTSLPQTPTTDSTRVSDTCPEPAGQSAIRVVGALRDGDQALTPLPVTGAPLARAVVATGPLVWTRDDGEVTLDATPGSRVVLLALSGENTPTVTDVLPYTSAGALTVARCGDDAWLWQAHNDGHHTLQHNSEVLPFTGDGALGAPVCAAGALGMRVDGVAQIGDQSVNGPAWWWTDTTSSAGRALPIPVTTRPILPAPGGWLLIDDAAPATLRIDPVAGALVPVGPDPWPMGTVLYNAASDDRTWVVSATVPGGSVLGGATVGTEGRVSVVHAVPVISPPWTIEVPVERGASVFTVPGGVFGWGTGVPGEVAAVDPRLAIQVVTSASERPLWLADACGHPALVGVSGPAWAVVDPRWDADCAAPAFGLVPANGANWTAVDETTAWVDLPPGSVVNGATLGEPKLARVTWTLGSRGFCEG